MTGGVCQGTVHYAGPAEIDGRQLITDYIPFNDLKWTNPARGYRIHLPSSGYLKYEDKKDHLPGLALTSIWTVEVTRIE